MKLWPPEEDDNRVELYHYEHNRYSTNFLPVLRLNRYRWYGRMYHNEHRITVTFPLDPLNYIRHSRIQVLPECTLTLLNLPPKEYKFVFYPVFRVHPVISPETIGVEE